ncbi:MAG: hypothetical protein VXW65_01685 [Pseudomonadota bacterium]|nr:hypothetical protein [Pseudomonadota bacterium]
MDIMNYTDFIPLSLDAIELREGSLYVVPQESRQLKVLKVLKLDSHGAHIRMYSNLLDDFPDEIDQTMLWIAGRDDLGAELGMGHLPISYQTLSAWGLRRIQHGHVSEDELEGYHVWQEAEGGYF